MIITKVESIDCGKPLSSSSLFRINQWNFVAKVNDRMLLEGVIPPEKFKNSS